MRTFCFAAVAALGLAACSPSAGSQRDTSGPHDSAAWPASLRVVGDGFPKSGDSCRIIGETAATVDLLDDTATLVGCRSEADAAKLGGLQVGKVAGIVLVSVPRGAPPPGDGDGQGDAKVAGTDFDATAQVRCAGYRQHPAGLCDAGVMRRTETGLTVVEITWPGGDRRNLYFDKDGKSAGADTSQADGSAAYDVVGTRQGDTTIVTIGPERYEIPDVFVSGD